MRRIDSFLNGHERLKITVICLVGFSPVVVMALATFRILP